MNRHAPAIALAATIAVQIVYPLTHGSLRDIITVLVVLGTATVALTHAATSVSVPSALRYAAIVGGIGFGAEVLGVATGFPFGCYSYSDRLGPQLFDVPLLIAVAWIGGVYPVWVVARLFVSRIVPRIAAIAVGITAWDLYLDPQMVVEGYWTWCAGQVVPPGMGTIPYTNFAGWLVVAAIMAVCLEFGARRARVEDEPLVPAILYLWTWLGSALAHVVFLDPSLRRTVAYGLVGMAILGVPTAKWVLDQTFRATRASADDLRR
jgi:uncharacterized membrane protein